MKKFINIKSVIVILGGALKKDADGKWRTTNFDEGDNFGISGDRLRVVAASYLYKKNPDQLIIVSGGKGQLKDVLPRKITLASVIEGELVEQGVPLEKIIKEERSGNTYQQLKKLLKILKKRKFDKITIISNKCHLPRVRAIIEYKDEFAQIGKLLNKKVKLVSAESIVILYQPKIWKKIIEKAYASREMKERLSLEKKGVREIKLGIYKFR